MDIDKIGTLLSEVRTENRIKEFARQRYEREGKPDRVVNYSETIRHIENLLALVEDYELYSDDGRIEEETRQLRHEAKTKLNQGVAKNTIYRSADRIESGTRLEDASSDLESCLSALQTMQSAHEWMVDNIEGVDFS